MELLLLNPNSTMQDHFVDLYKAATWTTALYESPKQSMYKNIWKEDNKKFKEIIILYLIAMLKNKI
jgi:hypothetical protein